MLPSKVGRGSSGEESIDHTDMHWGLNYLAKHAAQKVLGGVRKGFLVQELVKRSIGHWKSIASRSFVLSALETKISRFNAAGIAPPEVVVEQGTGWHGLDLLLFQLAGTRRIVTYDTRPWLREELLRYNARVLVDSADIVKRWCGTEPEAVDERAARLEQSLNRTWPELLESLGVTVRVMRSMDRSDLPPQSVDLFYSDSVLQFVAPYDLETLVAQARGFLKPTGVSFHVVDCSDFHTQKDERIPSLAYLVWPEFAWKLLTSRYLNYQNRLRMPQFADLFARHGLRSQVTHPILEAEDMEYARRHLAGRARFGGMTVEEIATRGFRLTSVRSDAPLAGETTCGSP